MSGSKVNPAGGSGTDDGRDSWCTPRWLAELLGYFNLDPCSNARSHIQAKHVANYQLGGDGLLDNMAPGSWRSHSAKTINSPDSSCRTFINPPYARGQAVRWIRHWKHTNFTFLLRWDPSTKWFAELLPKCAYVWFPNQRINFEPPPGVTSSSNPFPHALYMKAPLPTYMWDNLAANGWLLPIDSAFLSLNLRGGIERRRGAERSAA